MSHRLPAGWMCTLDERILEFVEEEPLSGPNLMASVMRFDASERRIRERCRMLAQAGLVAPVMGDYGMYEITRAGERYLEGDLDAEHQPRPDPRVSG
jgi:hypothetical protein